MILKYSDSVPLSFVSNGASGVGGGVGGPPQNNFRRGLILADK